MKYPSLEEIENEIFKNKKEYIIHLAEYNEHTAHKELASMFDGKSKSEVFKGYTDRHGEPICVLDFSNLAKENDETAREGVFYTFVIVLQSWVENKDVTLVEAIAIRNKMKHSFFGPF